MSSDDSISAGWNALDEEPVAVRVGATTAAPSPSAAPIRTATVPVQPKKIEHPTEQVNPRGMQLSAFAGIAVVLVGIIFYFGIDSLRGSLLGEIASSGVTVNVTKEGHFSPSTVSIAGGSTLTLVNQNTDPQVIKVKTGKDLFATQVLFDKPYVFQVPTDAAGTYTYFSETLPDTEILVITVTAPIETAISSSSASPQPTDTAPSSQIPLPFGGGDFVPEPAASSSAPSVVLQTQQSSSVMNTATTTTTNGTETITLGIAAQGSSSSSPASFMSNAIPTNPYTVSATKDLPAEGISQLEEISKLADTLHGGAPLQQITTHRPRTVTTTGPDVWFVLIPALALMYAAYRKMTYC